MIGQFWIETRRPKKIKKGNAQFDSMIYSKDPPLSYLGYLKVHGQQFLCHNDRKYFVLLMNQFCEFLEKLFLIFVMSIQSKMNFGSYKLNLCIIQLTKLWKWLQTLNWFKNGREKDSQMRPKIKNVMTYNLWPLIKITDISNCLISNLS